MFSEKKLPKARQKKQSIDIHHTSSGIQQKICISKLSIKMFIKRKTKTGKTYAY